MSKSNGVAVVEHEDHIARKVNEFTTNTDRRWWSGIGEKPRNVRLVLVTVDLANQWLERNSGNRKLRRSRVVQYSREMSSGTWDLNGDTIAFDYNGRLVNGQHRLSAIIDSGCATWMFVVFDVGDRAFSTTDCGLMRLGFDVLGIIGEKNAQSLSAMLTVAWYLHGGMANIVWCGSQNPTNQERLDLLEKIPEIRESIPVANRCKSLCAPSAAGAVHWLLAKINRKKADAMFDSLCTGAGLNQGDPLLALRNRFITAKTTKPGTHTPRISTQETAALLIKTWNAMILGGKKSVAIWRNNEPFPVPVEC